MKGVAVGSVVFVLCRGKGSIWLICKQDSSKVGPESDENGVQEGSGPPFGPLWAQCAPPVPPGSISLGDFPTVNYLSPRDHKIRV